MKKLVIILTILFFAVPGVFAASIVDLRENEGRYGSADGINSFFLRTPDWVDVVAITADTNSSYTLPTGAVYVVISSPVDDYWVKKDGAAAVPSAGVTNGTGSFLSPAQLNVRGCTSLGLIAESSCYVTIAVYR